MRRRLPQPAAGAWSGPVNPPISRGVVRRPSRLARWLGRLAATIAVALAGFAGYLVIEASLRSDAPAASPAPTVERPVSVPAHVPRWAWELHQWQLQRPAERGERPAAAPVRVPAWYWDWRAWRLALAPG